MAMDDPAKRRQRAAAYYQRHKTPNGHAVARERCAKDRVAIGKDQRGRTMTQRGRGKPKAKVDVEKLKQLVQAGCPMWEIAQCLEVHKDTLQQEPWITHILNAKAQRNVSLRLLQWQTARSGDVRMQMFLGKQWLGQTDYAQVYDPDMPEDLAPRTRHLEIVFVDSDGDGHPRRYDRIEAMPDDDDEVFDTTTLPQ
jgi:hypothetical protein